MAGALTLAAMLGTGASPAQAAFTDTPPRA
jgi:hypothetical protein